MHHHYYSPHWYPVGLLDGLNWDALSAIVMAVTAYLIYQQVKEARASSQYLEYSIRPSAWFFLQSARARRKRGVGVGNDKETMFVVKNESRQKILMYVSVELVSEKKKISQNLEDPLHLFPGGRMEYPDVLRLDEFAADEKVTATIRYSVAPSYAPNEKRDGLTETWRFEDGEWIGPNGIQSSNIAV